MLNVIQLNDGWATMRAWHLTLSFFLSFLSPILLIRMFAAALVLLMLLPFVGAVDGAVDVAVDVAIISKAMLLMLCC